MNELIKKVGKHLYIREGILLENIVKNTALECLVKHLIKGTTVNEGVQHLIGVAECLGTKYSLYVEHAPNAYVINAKLGSPFKLCGVCKVFKEEVDTLVLNYMQTNKPKDYKLYNPEFLYTYGVMCDYRIQNQVRECLNNKNLDDISDSWYRIYVEMNIHDIHGYINLSTSTNEILDVNIYNNEYGAPEGFLRIVVHTTDYNPDNKTYSITDTIIGRALYPLPKEVK